MLERREDFIAYALHKRIFLHAQRDPQKVRSTVLRNLRKAHLTVRGKRNHEILDTWESAACRGDLVLLQDLCLREDEYGIEVRQLGPFAGVLSLGERRQVLADAHSTWNQIRSTLIN